MAKAKRHFIPGCAASGSVLTNLASVYLSENWIEKEVLVVCSDDYGYCGSLILSKPEIEV